MELYLVRHGIAENVAASGRDADRALTPEGQKKTGHVARAFSKRVPEIDLILHSPYRRARETAAIFAEVFPQAEVREGLGLTPYDQASFALPQLQELKKGSRTMLIGHEPHLSCMASLLLTGSDRPILEFRKAGIAGIASTGHLHSCYLMFLLTPKMLLS